MGSIDIIGSLIPNVQIGADSYYIPFYKWILSLGFNGVFYAFIGGIQPSIRIQEHVVQCSTPITTIFINKDKETLYMNADHQPVWKVFRDSNGHRYLTVELDGRQMSISARCLKELLPELYGTIPYTKRQLALMDFIREYRDSHRISPTLEEIAEELGVSKITAYQHIEALEKKGALTHQKYHRRSLMPLDPHYL